MSKRAPIRVLVADDHTMVRQGIVGILRTNPEIDVVAEAGDGAEATRKALETRPDVVVLDVSMPRLNGFEAARRIHEALPDARILILTMQEEEEYVLRSVRAGASGYLVKDGPASELLAGIRALGGGETWFGPQAQRALERAREKAGSDGDGNDGAHEDGHEYSRLTDREREVFHLIAEGRTNGRIAAILEISPKTVDNHRTRLMDKLGLHSVAELVRYASKNHLIP